MAISASVSALGDILLRRYTVDYIAKLQALGDRRGNAGQVIMSNDQVMVIQKHKSIRNPEYGHVPDAPRRINVKSGKEYWVPLTDDIRVCRRTETIWGFRHMCGWTRGAEVRKSPKKDVYMKCVGCGKKFPPKAKLIKLALSTYPNIGTIKFVAGLAKGFNAS